MSNVLLIIEREFLSRVKKRSFLLVTILVPLIFPAIMALLFFFIMQEQKSAKIKTVYVLNEAADIQLENTRKYEFVPQEGSLEELKEKFATSDAFALLHIPNFDIQKPEGITLFTLSNPGLSTVNDFSTMLENQVRELKLTESGISREVIDQLKTNVGIRSVKISQGGEEKAANAGISFGIGYVAVFLIYMFIFIYGSQVMQGVIEEKSSRIVEIMVSSVKPFQLMIGKVIGIASVGLVQVLIWVILITVFSALAFSLLGLNNLDPELLQEMSKAGGTELPEGINQGDIAANPMVQEALLVLNDTPFVSLVLNFLFFFIGGYLLYGALFAAVGSAVESIQDAQQFTFPVTIPLIFALIATFSVVLQDPTGNLAFWLSIIPFTSPIAMMARVPFGVPAWELALSMVLLILGFLGTVWVAGRIYRVGILFHGAKVNYKTLAKWVTYKG